MTPGALRPSPRVLVTGGNRGLGRATAERLARRGCEVVLTARDAAKGEAACVAIRAAVPGARVEHRPLDLASQASIRAFAVEWGDAPLDALLASAGVMQQSPTRRLVDGIEETLAVNALGPFLLVRLLLPALERAPAARVVCVSSRMHLPGSRGAEVRFDLDDPMLERGYDPNRAYKNSKLALLWFTYELARRLPPRPITANAVCPGFVPVTAAESTHGAEKLLLKTLLRVMPFARSVEQASGHFADMILDPSLAGVSGAFYADGKPMRSSDESYDEDKQRRFWDLAEQLTHPPPWPARPRATPT